MPTNSNRVEPPRLSPTERTVLELLGRGEHYGLELVAASEGLLKRGTVYVTLGRMETKGLVASRHESEPPPNGGLPRGLYSVTPVGRHVMTAWTRLVGRLTVEFGR